MTTFAWLVKPLIGYAIDSFLNKRAWILISVLIDIILSLFLGLAHLPVFLLITLLMATSASAAFRDVTVDGIMCVEGKLYHATGKIQSIQWASISIAGLLTGVGGGYIAEKWGYKEAFLLLIPVYILVAVTAYFFKEHRPQGIAGGRKTLAFDMKRLFTDKKLLIVCLFIFLYRYSPSFGTPLFFIQRDSFQWNKIWIGTLATIATVFSIAGSLFYYKFSQRINLKKWIFWSVFLGAITTISYLYYTPVTAVIYDIIYSFLGMFIFVMVMDFMARKSTPGLEATSFALLCSVSNLALIASNLSGAFMLPAIGLKWLIVISALASFLCLPLIKKIK